MHDVLEVANEFFEMPAKDKESLYSEDPKQTCRVHTSINYDSEKVHYWRDNLRHPCHPLEEHMQIWPEKPARYRYDLFDLTLWLEQSLPKSFLVFEEPIRICCSSLSEEASDKRIVAIM